MYNITTINSGNLEKQISGLTGIFGVDMRLPVGSHALPVHAEPAMAMKMGSQAVIAFGPFIAK